MSDKILISLPEDKINRLRDIAKYHGYKLDRSQLKGAGSVRQMLEALADGELVLYPAINRND
jgi:hypothetical protein